MTSHGHPKGTPNPEPLALRIATKSAFLASRTAKDAAISTLAQQSAEHTRLQEIHRDLVVRLEEKEMSILNLKETAAKARAASTERELELQHAAGTARTALSQEEAEHARLKERHRDCITELERKDAEILDLHSKIKDLSKEHNDATHAAHTASTEHEVELSHLRTLFHGRNAELEQKSSQITELNGTIERLTRECSDLKESETGLQEALNRQTRDLNHAEDAAALSEAQHEAEQRRLQDLLHGHATQVEAKEAQILDLQEKSESLAQENSNLKSNSARVDDDLAAMTQNLRRTAADAFAKITAANAAKVATHQRMTELLSTVEALEKDALHYKRQLKDAAQVQAQTETKRRDAVDTLLKNKAASDQLKRDNALLSSEVNNLQARKESLVEQLASVHDAHARTKEELCTATRTIAELKTSEAKARDINATLAMRIMRLILEKQALQTRLETPPPPPPPTTGVLHQMHVVQLPVLPVQASWVRDDSDLYDWNAAKASGLFDFWSNNLHGSEIMPLLSIETSQDHMVASISKLLFPQESHGLVGWLTQRSQDHNLEQRRLQVVHLLNDSMHHYGCSCHRVHIFLNGSQDQDAHVRFALEALRVYGEFEDVCDMFVAILSCFNGRFCLSYLEECGIFLDHKERELLTQKCQDKLRGVRSETCSNNSFLCTGGLMAFAPETRSLGQARHCVR